MEWSSGYSVNVAEIDKQHKELFRLINKLSAAMKERRAKDVLAAIINDLISYTGTHFLYEEKLFDKLRYSETAEHKKEHKDFVKQVTDFKKGFDEGRLMVSLEIMKFLQDWLVKHIKGTDKKYSKFFNDNNIK